MGRLPALIALVVVVMLGMPAAALAATKTRIEPPRTTSSFGLRGSNGYRVEVTAQHTGDRSAKVTVEAVRERYKVEMVSVAYSTHGRPTRGGGFDAKLPGLGRIAVDFEQSGVRKVTFDGGPNCSDRPVLLRKGTYRGTISFRGEHGFTKVHGRSAPGLIREASRQVCHEEVDDVAGEPGATEAPLGPQNPYLFAAGPSGAAAVTFWAAGPRTEPPGASGSGLPTVAFEATYSTRRRGLQISARASVDTSSNHFSVPGPVGTLADATAEPPAPFKGSAVYHLEAPTTASWAGDLSAAFPGIGTVPLTGPGISARLCEGLDTCTGARG